MCQIKFPASPLPRSTVTDTLTWGTVRNHRRSWFCYLTDTLTNFSALAHTKLSHNERQSFPTSTLLIQSNALCFMSATNSDSVWVCGCVIVSGVLHRSCRCAAPPGNCQKHKFILTKDTHTHAHMVTHNREHDTLQQGGTAALTPNLQHTSIHCLQHSWQTAGGC